jgi:hypothetical protein
MYQYHLQCYLAVSKADVESQIRSNFLRWCLYVISLVLTSMHITRRIIYFEAGETFGQKTTISGL